MNIPPDLALAIQRGKTDLPYFAKELLGMPMHKGQKKFAANSCEKVNILIPGNRWGKSVYLALRHIWANFYKQGVVSRNSDSWAKTNYLTLNLGPKLENAKVVADYVEQILKSSFPIRQDDGSEKSNRCLLEWFLLGRDTAPQIQLHFANNSHLLIRSTRDDKGSSIQGKKFGYASYDECSRSLHLEMEVKANILPRLTDFNGKLDLASTPDAAGGASLVYFQEIFWKGGGEGHAKSQGFYSQEGSVYENEFLDKASILELERTLAGDPLAEQILHGKFVITGDVVFPVTEINKAKRDMPETIHYKTGHEYIIGCDTAMASDEFCFTVVDVSVEPFEVVRFSSRKGNSDAPEMHLQNLIDVFDEYNKEYQCTLWLETFNGEAGMWYSMLPDHIKSQTKLFGSWRPPGVSKHQVDKKEKIMLSLRKLLSEEKIIFSRNHKKIINQLAIYTMNKSREKNLKTDAVFATALAAYGATDGKPAIDEIQFIETEW